MLTAAQIAIPPSFFSPIPDPRRAPRTATSPVHGVGHCRWGRPLRYARLPRDLRLGAKSRAEIPRALRVPSRRGVTLVPSEYVIRDVLIRVAPAHLDRAFRGWNEAYARQDETLAIDGKDHVQRPRRGGSSDACDERRRSSEQNLLHPKKVGTLPIAHRQEVKRTNEIKMAIPLLETLDIKGKEVSADAC